MSHPAGTVELYNVDEAFEFSHTHTLFQVPDWQRGYEWPPEYQAVLFIDTYKLAKRRHDRAAVSAASQHPLNMIILLQQRPKEGKKGKEKIVRKDIVDGQQRIITIILLLSAIRWIAHHIEVAKQRLGCAQQMGDLLLTT